jgi:hypothetical protein
MDVISCNRFEKEFVFQTVEEFEIVFIEIANNSLKTNNIQPLLSFYWQRYNNEGATIFDMNALFTSERWTENVLLTIEKTDVFEYTLKLTDTIVKNEQTIEFIEEWTDRIERQGRVFLWTGFNPEPLENPQQFVIVQSLTYLTCNSCPRAKQELKKIQRSFSNNFLYLSYHSHPADPLSLYNRFEEERRYWGGPNAPYVLIQGQLGYEGANSINLYKQQVKNLIEEPTSIKLSDLYATNPEERLVEGNVTITFTETDLIDLYLFFVIYQRKTDYYYLYGNGEKASNVVRARGYQELENLISGQVVGFSIIANQDIDSDSYIAVWVQKIADFNRRQDTDKIFNAQTISIQ